MCIDALQTLEALSGADGKVLWRLVDSEARDARMSVYTGQFVYDLDGDSVADIVVAHGGESFAEPGDCDAVLLLTCCVLCC